MDLKFIHRSFLPIFSSTQKSWSSLFKFSSESQPPMTSSSKPTAHQRARLKLTTWPCNTSSLFFLFPPLFPSFFHLPFYYWSFSTVSLFAYPIHSPGVKQSLRVWNVLFRWTQAHVLGSYWIKNQVYLSNLGSRLVQFIW